MEASPDSRYATPRFGRTAKAVAGGVVFAACLLSLVLAGRSKGYQSQALLSYSSPWSSSGEGAIPATVAASLALDDAHLLVILNSHDLYPQLRQRSPEQAVLAHLRSLMTLDEPAPSSLRISFLDEDERESRSVTDDLAAILAAYRVAEPARPVPSSAPAANPMPGPASAIPVPNRPAGPVSAASPEAEVRSRHRLALVTAQLSVLREEQAGRSARSGAETRTEPVRGYAHPPSSELRNPPPPAQPSASQSASQSADRAALEGRLAFEQSHLVALLVRYTEEYPEVIATRGTIAELETRLASMPAPGPAARLAAGERSETVPPQSRQSSIAAVAATDGSAAADRYERNQRRIAALERERDALTARLAATSTGVALPSASTDKTTWSQAVPAAVPPTPAAGSASPATDTASPATDQANTASSTALPTLFEPFQIEQRALASVLVRMYPPRVYAWIAMGTGLLLLLILLPGLLRPAAKGSEPTEYERFLEMGMEEVGMEEVGMESVPMYRPESSEEMESAGEGIGETDAPGSRYARIGRQAAAFSASADSRERYAAEEFATQAVAHHALPPQARSSESAAPEPEHREEHREESREESREGHGSRAGDGERGGNLDSRIARAVAKHYGS